MELLWELPKEGAREEHWLCACVGALGVCMHVHVDVHMYTQVHVHVCVSWRLFITYSTGASEPALPLVSEGLGSVFTLTPFSMFEQPLCLLVP